MADDRMELARKIVDCIIADLTDRRGLRQAWEDIDAGIQQEIRDQWCDIISPALLSAPATPTEANIASLLNDECLPREIKRLHAKMAFNKYDFSRLAKRLEIVVQVLKALSPTRAPEGQDGGAMGKFASMVQSGVDPITGEPLPSVKPASPEPKP